MTLSIRSEQRMSICKQCGKEFKPHKFVSRWQRYCSLACQRAWYREHLNQPPAICAGCGRTFIPKAPDRRMYCTRECAFQHKTWLKAKRAERAREAAEQKHQRTCIVCGAIFKGRPDSKYCSRDCHLIAGRQVSLVSSIKKDKRDRSQRECHECGAMFVPEYGNKRRYYCSKRCSKRYQHRIASGVRRAKKKNSKRTSVDPIRIFERDKWRCQLCGRKTLKSKRGMIDDRAPELDHIVPLAHGGERIEHNVQCTCRKCNQEKGAKARGQLRLAI